MTLMHVCHASCEVQHGKLGHRQPARHSAPVISCLPCVTRPTALLCVAFRLPACRRCQTCPCARTSGAFASWQARRTSPNGASATAQGGPGSPAPCTRTCVRVRAHTWPKQHAAAAAAAARARMPGLWLPRSAPGAARPLAPLPYIGRCCHAHRVGVAVGSGMRPKLATWCGWLQVPALHAHVLPPAHRGAAAVEGVAAHIPRFGTGHGHATRPFPVPFVLMVPSLMCTCVQPLWRLQASRLRAPGT